MGSAICRGTNVRYLARARRYKAQMYTLLGGASRSRAVAWKRLGEAMMTNNYKQGDLLLLADYYDPVQLYKVTAR